MKHFAILALVVIFSSCKSSIPDLTGEYKNKDWTKMEMFTRSYLGGQALVVGSSLELNADRSFEYQTCGNIMTGTWSVKKDSLMLNIKTNRFQIDSLNEVGFEGRKLVQEGEGYFLIRGNDLVRKEDARFDDETMKSFVKLVKVEK